MEQKEWKSLLKESAKEIEIDLNEQEMNQLYDYQNLVLNWNEKINLTAIRDEREFVMKHFIDSLTICKYIEENQKVIDIGTGAGFPGIPLKIVKQIKDLTLMDSLQKRITVLEDISEKLKISSLQMIHGRAEEVFQNQNHREKYDVAVSRAVAALNVLVELMLPAVKVGGICLCMKGNNVKQEIETAEKAISILGGRIIKIDSILLPELKMERNIVVIQKEKKTPQKYPRKPGIPQKQPLS